METPRPRNYIEQKYQEIRSLPLPLSTLLLLFSTEIMGRVLPLYTEYPSRDTPTLYPLCGYQTWKFRSNVFSVRSLSLFLSSLSSRYAFVKSVRFISVYTCATTPVRATCRYLLRRIASNERRGYGEVYTNWDINGIRFKSNVFFLVSDGNAAGTGPGDPWTGGSGGVQPPYSGYAPPHLAQPAYPMHLPHDPMVRRLSLVPFFRSSSPSYPPRDLKGRF